MVYKIETMSLDQLRYFVTVAEEQNLTRAAEKLRLSQPPLTRHIRALEDELGVQLFERTPKGMTLLPAGSRLLTLTLPILQAVAALSDTFAEPKQGVP